MTAAGRFYVLSSAIALVAMASRTGWIDWPAIATVAAIVCFGSFWLVALFLAGAVPIAFVGLVTFGAWRLLSRWCASRRPA